MNTIIAIPVWEDQVSTTFDFARKLLLVEAVGERELSRREGVSMLVLFVISCGVFLLTLP